MKIDIKLLNNTLAAEEVQAEQVNKVIDGFFGLLHACSDNNRTDMVTNIRPTVTLEAKNKTELDQKITETLKKETASQNPSKVLPKINNERTLNVPIGEMINLAPSNVREIDGSNKLYQASYHCDCGHSGKRFIPETNYYLKCHNCNDKLLVEPATLEQDENGIPKPDVEGNFFIARELYEVTGD